MSNIGGGALVLRKYNENKIKQRSELKNQVKYMIYMFNV
jgi:hypothetical protein